MGKGNVFDYFKKGFTLANKSLDIFLIALTLSILSEFSGLLKGNALIGSAVQAAGILISFVWFGFIFSLPLFLKERQEGKPLKLSYIFSFLWDNVKKMILPSLVIGSIIALVFFTLFLIFQFIFNAVQSPAFYITLFALIAGFMPFISFGPIYFSLEKNNFYKAVQKSCSLSLKNLNFVAIIFLFYSLIFLIFGLLSIDKNLRQLITLVIFNYGMLVVFASSLIFFLKKK